MQPLPSMGKHANGVKWENMKLLPSLEKYHKYVTTGAKCKILYNGCQVRKNI